MNIKKFEQKGAVLPMIAIGLLAILGTAGLAIDLGHGYLNNSRLQNALDAAALSGARTLMITGKDEAAASIHARDAFDAHLNGEMSGLSSANMVIQYSRLLNPFTNGTPDANFIRVGYNNFATGFSFSNLLPGVGDSMNISSTAVAGPIPVGTDDGGVCNLAPIMMCGDPGPPDDPPPALPVYSQTDTNCGVFDPLVDPVGSGDYECFGYTVVPPGGANGDCHVLKSGSPGGMTDPTFNGVDCHPLEGEEGEEGVGPGNFQLARIDPNCPGGDCVREAMAGAHNSCSLAGASTIPSEPGNTAGPSWQGLNTRFNQYQGGMLTAAEYPPDRIINSTYWHNQYMTETAAQINSGFGKPLRRLITVPVVECDGTQNGQSDLPLLGYACFFLLEPLPGMGSGDIKGQLVLGCESGGYPGTDPGTSDPSAGPYQIILYKDPDSAET